MERFNSSTNLEKLITPLYAQQNQVRLRWMSTVLLLRMRSLIKRCFAFQRSLNLQFVEFDGVQGGLYQISTAKAGFQPDKMFPQFTYQVLVLGKQVKQTTGYYGLIAFTLQFMKNGAQCTNPNVSLSVHQKKICKNPLNSHSMKKTHHTQASQPNQRFWITVSLSKEVNNI